MNCNGRDHVCLKTKRRHTAADIRALASALTPELRQEIREAIEANAVDTEAKDLDRGDANIHADTVPDNVGEHLVHSQNAEAHHDASFPPPSISQFKQDRESSFVDVSLAQNRVDSCVDKHVRRDGAVFTDGGPRLDHYEDQADKGETRESEADEAVTGQSSSAKRRKLRRKPGLPADV